MKRNAGFTLLEFAVVMVISGFLMIAAVHAYLVYLQDSKQLTNRYRIKAIETSLNQYANNPAKGRYPCPSDPSLPMNDANAGLEVCPTIAGFPAVGNCNTAGWPYPNSKAGAICHLDGARDTLYDGETILADPIIIGGVPFRTLAGGSAIEDVTQLNLTDAQDPWGYQYTYAVTDSVTVTANSTWGAIDVRSESTTSTANSGVGLLLPEKSAVFVVAGHGPDHSGAYNAQGNQVTPCGSVPPAGAVDNFNCNRGNTFINGLRSDGPGTTHYDDIVTYSSGYINSLWDIYDSNDNLRNINVGSVGVGTMQAGPVSALELKNNSLFVETNVKVCNTAGTICWFPTPDAPRICDLTSNCFQPEWLGGYDGSDSTNPDNPATIYSVLKPSGNQCPVSATVGKVNVVYGLSNGQVLCTADGDASHPPITPVALPVGHVCPGADTGTLPQYYVTEVLASGVRCCDINGDPEPGFTECQIY